MSNQTHRAMPIQKVVILECDREGCQTRFVYRTPFDLSDAKHFTMEFPDQAFKNGWQIQPHYGQAYCPQHSDIEPTHTEQ